MREPIIYVTYLVAGSEDTVVLDPAIFNEHHVAGCAEVCKDLIFFMIQTDSGLDWDPSLQRFEISDREVTGEPLEV